jgi:hypothetical protein
MKMIRHQAAGVDSPLRLGASFAQGFEEARPVGVVLEDRLTVIAPVSWRDTSRQDIRRAIGAAWPTVYRHTGFVSIVRSDPLQQSSAISNPAFGSELPDVGCYFPNGLLVSGCSNYLDAFGVVAFSHAAFTDFIDKFALAFQRSDGNAVIDEGVIVGIDALMQRRRNVGGIMNVSGGHRGLTPQKEKRG